MANPEEEYRPMAHETDAAMMQAADSVLDLSGQYAISPEITQWSEHRGRIVQVIGNVGRIATTAYEWAGFSALPEAVNILARILPGRTKNFAPAVMGVAAGVAFTKLGGLDFSHLLSHGSDALMANGGGHQQNIENFRLLAAHHPTPTSDQIGSHHHPIIQNQSVLTGQKIHADKYENRSDSTVSQAYDNLPGSFQDNWQQMLHDARSSQKAGDLRVIYPLGKASNPNSFFYEVMTAHGWTSNNSKVLRVMAEYSGGHRVYTGSSIAEHARYDINPAAKKPLAQPTAASPPDGRRRLEINHYVETTPWWVWPSIIGAGALGLVAGATLSSKSKTEHRKRKVAGNGSIHGTSRLAQAPSRETIARNTPIETDSKARLQNQVRSILLDPKSQPVSEFLTQVRSLNLRDRQANAKTDERAAAALIAYGEAMRTEGVIKGDDTAEALNAHMAAAAIVMGTAKFYQDKGSELRVSDGDNFKSTRTAAAQLKGRYQHLPTAAAFLGNELTDKDLMIIGDDDIGYDPDRLPKPGTNLLWDYSHNPKESEEFRTAALELRLHLQNILNRIWKASNSPFGTLIALGLDSLVNVRGENGQYTFEDKNIQELAKRLVNLHQPEPQVRTAPELAELGKSLQAGQRALSTHIEIPRGGTLH